MLVASVAFSSKAIMVKLAYVYSMNAATLIALRMLFSIPFFMGLINWMRHSKRTLKLSLSDVGLMIFIGVLTG